MMVNRGSEVSLKNSLNFRRALDVLARAVRENELNKSQKHKCVDIQGKREREKKKYIKYLLCLKLICKSWKISMEKEDNPYLPKGYLRQEWLKYGSWVRDVIYEMIDKKIQLTPLECKTIFSIPDKVWEECYGDKSPERLDEMIFVYKLSEAAFCEAMIDHMIDTLLNNPELSRKLARKAEEIFGFKFKPLHEIIAGEIEGEQVVSIDTLRLLKGARSG